MRSKLTSEVKVRVKSTGKPSKARQDGDKGTTNAGRPSESEAEPGTSFNLILKWAEQGEATRATPGP